MTNARAHDGRGQEPKAPVGARIIDGKYALLREIGSGAAATVYEAEHLIVGKRVAIKVMHSFIAKDESLVQRFIGEARAVAQIGHENLVDIYDFGVTDDKAPYLVMELLGGETLEALLHRRGALPPTFACELMVQVLAGVAAAHSLGIVHRDLKPANIFVTHPRPDRPLVKVLDFGIAKGVAAAAVHHEAGLLGTPLYMSPEQAMALTDVDERSDLYALGVILYEMLAGEPPYGGDMGDVLQKVIRGQVRPLASVNPAVPRLLTHAVAFAMKTNRDQRVRTAREFAYQLAPYVSQPPPHSIPDGPRSAHAFMLTAKDAGIRMQSSGADLRRIDFSRPPRDFPSFGLARLAGKPNGEPLSDDLLQSPIIPRAPSTPHIQSFGSDRDLEHWSSAPAYDPHDEPTRPSRPVMDDEPSPERTDRAEHSDPAPARRLDRRYLADAPDSVDRIPMNETHPWRRAMWATALGVGLGAALAWLSYMG